jgi:hypothetical protein
MTGNTKLQAVNALTVIREQEEVISRLTAERDELLARVEQLESGEVQLGNKENI